MLGLSIPFWIVIGIIILARVALALYVWWSFRRLKKRVRELES
jgi:hypothetical protein